MAKGSRQAEAAAASSATTNKAKKGKRRLKRAKNKREKRETLSGYSVLSVPIGSSGEPKFIYYKEKPSPPSILAANVNTASDLKNFAKSLNLSGGYFVEFVSPGVRRAEEEDLWDSVVRGVEAKAGLGGVALINLEGGGSQEKAGDHQGDGDSSGFSRVLDRFKGSLLKFPKALQEQKAQCDRILAAYGSRESEKSQSYADNKGVPDDDGWITVSYKNSAIGEGERKVEAMKRRGEQMGAGRKRSKKLMAPPSGLEDFYRFQRKEKLRKEEHKLKLLFQKDRERLEEMKRQGKFQITSREIE